jgi:hypothetical protein
MNKLSAEAYAIVEGRHADPFRYLGVHTEGDKTVVRAFLPEASTVEAVGEHGETAKLSRIHDAGLFTGTCSSTTPTVFRPFSASTTSICSAKAPISGSMTSSARIRG